MLQIITNQTYKLRLMPNINILGQNALLLEYTTMGNNPFHSKKYFSYVMEKEHGKYDPMKIFKYSNQIKNFIQKTRQGYYCTSEGYLIDVPEEYGKDVKYYFANEDKSIITLDSFNAEDHGWKKYNDIRFQEPVNLFDVKSKYLLEFKTRTVTLVGFRDLIEYYHLRIVEDEPLYVEGLTVKDEIIALYSNMDSLESTVVNEQERMVKENPKLTIIFGEESKAAYWKWHNKIKAPTETVEKDFFEE